MQNKTLTLLTEMYEIATEQERLFTRLVNDK